MNRGRSFRGSRSAFTLIELMIVIAIIGVLAAIAVPNFKAARERANVKACHANQKTLEGALEQYNLDTNKSVEVMDRTTAGMLASSGYLQAVPQDPGQGSTWNYSMESGLILCTVHGPRQSASPASADGGVTTIVVDTRWIDN